ncbi:bacteriohopanetetrol glucosamine biosynthesis glycosyltransferase HpnI [Phaeovibrio sulfidiphilus]|uniref:Bacteriohopanetetrol glucosamine biosynthesis glycosyltransferase HpnI n=1 Tax=Phaeovibrio sulfidiphilus TaxID=1220600 RepID=A0A8J6YQQ5_9PROT|nr:bacteriohopanetetrol glucosamine biosynthesis glycosyltransferase HpnI [Phaeovibrio sulfidiphilus]MBE1237612.1 bacteriohopanetetrol glucosamine biosynthesis glycosyltransferase HpnI [Phaeovibrio sulfidiphilus]
MALIFSVLSFVLLIVFVASCGYVLASVLATRRFVRASARERDRTAFDAAAARPVSVLKPLHGLEDGLLENLRSFCRQTYPEFQIVFGVHSPDDPALAVARAVRDEFPGHDIAIVVNDAAPFRNRKVSNLDNMMREARHPWLVLADSDMRVAPDYLATVTAPLADPANGAVTCLYRGVVSDSGLWSALGAMHINFNFLPEALLGDWLGVGDGCFGATIALSRETLERIGGFAAIGDHLADDHALGQAVRALGLRVVLSRALVDTMVSEPTSSSLLDHELRWAHTVFLVQPAGYMGSFLTFPVPLAVLAAAFLPLWAGGTAVASAIALRWLSVHLLARLFSLATPEVARLVLRDAISFYIFVTSFFRRKLVWRGHTLTSLKNGTIVQLEKNARS